MPSNKRGAKSHAFPTKGNKQGNHGMKGKDKKSKAAQVMKSESDSFRCRFLELPPELRNRIYYFAEEYEYFSEDAEILPLLIKPRIPSPLTKPAPWSARKYFALTQVCKQVRKEYRPLWLRNSSVKLTLPNLTSFVNTYYPKIDDYKNLPNLLLISWDHEVQDPDNSDDSDDETLEGVLFDITLLLRMRAHCSTSEVAFESRRVAEADFHNRLCEECGHTIYCDCDEACSHEDAIDDAMYELYMEYQYIRVLNKFLENRNEEWLKLIREDARCAVEIEFTFDLDTQHPTIYIRFAKGRAPAVFTKKDMYKSAFRFFRQMDMLQPEKRDAPDYVIGEATGKYTRHDEGCSYPVAIYNQVHISAPTLKKTDTGT